jgi:acyl CoA:acetate/3-ketoacid CoA transferase alpha subunit
MATATSGYTWASGNTVTPARLNDTVNDAVITLTDLEVTNAKVANATLTNAKFAGSVGLNAWLSKTTTYTAVAGDRITANTDGGPFTVTLPSSPADYTEVTFADHGGNWKTNNLTVARNGSNINGLGEDLVCDVAAKQITLRYEGATIGWRVYA